MLSCFSELTSLNRDYCLWCLYLAILSTLDWFQTRKQVKFQFASWKHILSLTDFSTLKIQNGLNLYQNKMRNSHSDGNSVQKLKKDLENRLSGTTAIPGNLSTSAAFNILTIWFMERKTFCNMLLCKTDTNFLTFLHKCIHIPSSGFSLQLYFSCNLKMKKLNPFRKYRIYSLCQRTGCWSNSVLQPILPNCTVSIWDRHILPPTPNFWGQIFNTAALYHYWSW